MRRKRDIRTEDGGVLVAATIIIAVLVLLSVGVIQVGAWFQDRRHLQVRADAGVLAGAQLFNECFVDQLAGLDPRGDIERTASQYAGFSSYNGSPLVGAFAPAQNTAFAAGSNAIAFQSTTYPGGGGSGPDDTNTADECSSLALDVKLTRDVAGTFSFSPLAHVHAHARVELKKTLAARPSLPIAIPAFDTSQVGVTFVDESTGNELTGCTGSILPGKCTFASTTPPSSFTTNGVAYKQFSLSGLSVNVPTLASGTNFKDIGVRVSVGSAIDGSCAKTDGTNNYACFELGSNNGASLILAYRSSQPATAPTLTGITPTSTCATGASPFFSDSSGGTTCTVSLTATADFPAVASNKKVTAKIKNNGTNVGTCTLTNGGGSSWSGTCTPAVPVDANGASSEYNVELDYSYTTGGNTVADCFASCLTVARFTSATDEDEGPVKDLLVSAYSAPAGAAKSVDVTITVATAGITNKLQLLRAAHKGSATSYILCYQKNPPNGGVENGTPGIQDGIVNGCTLTYSINKVGTCPDVTTPFPDCAENKPSNDSGNPISKAFNDRFDCGTATESKNYWPDYSRPGDKRAVTLVITSYNAYSNGGKNNGKDDYPVIGFGNFYVTGFDGSNCAKKPADPLGEEPPPPGASGKGDVWGYFIKYSRQGDIPSGEQCVASELGQCIAVLTR